MVWFVIGILVVLAGGAAVLFVVLHATADDASAEGPGPAAPFGGEDATPAGDTSELAGEQTSGGETAGQPDAEASGGAGANPGRSTTHDRGAGPRDLPGGRGRFESGTIGGEAESEPATEVGEPPHPDR